MEIAVAVLFTGWCPSCCATSDVKAVKDEVRYYMW